MILLICPFGLANRFFYFTHCITLAEATGHRVVCFNIPEAKSLASGRNGTLCVWPPDSGPGVPLPNGLRRCCTLALRKLADWCSSLGLPLPKIIWATQRETRQLSADNAAFVQMLRSRHLIVMRGWISIETMKVSDPEGIRAFFTPTREIRLQCEETVRRAREGANVLVGIHCRWRDYREYANGRYYYSEEVYARMMKRCAELFPGKRVAFLVVSDEPGRLANSMGSFAPMQVTPGPGSVMGDLYSLAECDYIVCPASSFSLWAAFYGKKPCWCLKDPEAHPKLEDFVTPDGTFEGLHPPGNPNN
jgi:hypothetical protein